jgi:DNA-binding CsgD family transcriptional regulator
MLTYITPAQKEVAAMWSAGLSTQEIARRRGTGLSCVSNLVRRASKRLGVRGRRALAAALLECEVRHAPGRRSARGFMPGDPVRIVSGRFVGRSGVYVGGSNSTQINIRIGLAVFSLQAASIEAAS